eukprot:2463400-Amphidinium_carterae.2
MEQEHSSGKRGNCQHRSSETTNDKNSAQLLSALWQSMFQLYNWIVRVPAYDGALPGRTSWYGCGTIVRYYVIVYACA